ncbi:MAG TPA: hypothetical protein VG734_25720 [Lacunisphaera sp.]|nr:hypothetical protein [Lacunisphaera sp.]
MRKLVWWAKADPSKNTQADWVDHPWHSGPALFVNGHAVAYNYVAQMVSQNILAIRHHLGVGDAHLQFIPVPSSDVLQATARTARWSGREIATRLAKLGVGSVGPLIVNRQPMPKKNQGANPTFTEIRKNLVQAVGHGAFLPNSRVVYIDDVVTNGNHIAALDDFCGSRLGATAICIASTDSIPRDAYECRLRKITVDPAPFMSRLGPEASVFDI